MKVVVKTPPIEVTAETIPEELMNFLKDHYKKVEIIEDEEGEDITETNWYREMQGRSNPGTTLRRYRKRAEMSQSELAEKLGMVKQNVSAMERGTRGISKLTARKLGEIFQVSPGRFI